MTQGHGDLSPADAATLDRTRSAVMNVLVFVGLGIGLSGFVLGRKERGALLVQPPDIQTWSYGLLLSIFLMSVITRRVLGARDRLRDRQTRSRQFFLAHLVSAGIGALAVPLGFAYGWLIRPRIDGVGPFWVAALVLGVMAYPRAHELHDLDD
jgi:hypothetical protein